MMLSDLNKIDCANQKIKLPRPSVNINDSDSFDRMDEVTGFLSGSVYAHKSFFESSRDERKFQILS